MGHFYGLDDQMNAAYQTGDLAKARSLADEYLRLADRYPCDWNYGNALHDANAMLGLVSLKSGDPDTAASYLLKAGKTPGSPQLDSFGPDMGLANGLLQAGKIDAVKTYLHEIRSFWTMDYGAIDAWTAAIDRGERPDMNRAFVPMTTMSPAMRGIFIVAALMPYIWTAVLILVFFLIRSKHIARKPLFLLIGGTAAFCTMLLGSLGSGYLGQYVISSTDSIAIVTALWGLMLLLVALLPLLALYIVSRFFRLAPAS
jgi:hypothetical protein